MNVELKRIAEKKLEQMGATVHGVLVKNEAGAWAAVSEGGRVMWLDDFEGQAARAQGGQGVDHCRCVGSGNGCDCTRCEPQPAQPGALAMSDLPLHRTMQDDEIDRLKAQLKEYEEKGRVLMDMCRDFKRRVGELEKCVDDGSDAWLLRKQAEAVEKCHINTCLAVSKDAVRNHLYCEAQRLRQQADEAEQDTNQ